MKLSKLQQLAMLGLVLSAAVFVAGLGGMLIEAPWQIQCVVLGFAA